MVPVRCIRIHTNINLTRVRFNSVQYNIRDLESKIYVPERNWLIVDTWSQYVRNRRTVIFCASVKPAQEIAGRLHDASVAAEAASNEIKASDRREMLARFDKGERPDALIDWSVDAQDYELVDIFNWQEEAAGIISQMEFVRRVDVQTETIEWYVRDSLLAPDLVVPMSEHRTFKYCKEEMIQEVCGAMRLDADRRLQPQGPVSGYGAADGHELLQ